MTPSTGAAARLDAPPERRTSAWWSAGTDATASAIASAARADAGPGRGWSPVTYRRARLAGLAPEAPTTTPPANAAFDWSSTDTAAPAIPAAALPSAMTWTGARRGERPLGEFVAHRGRGVGGPQRGAVEIEQEFAHSLVWGPGPRRPRSTP